MFTPAMLSVNRDKSVADGIDLVEQLPEDVGKLGVEICLLPPVEESEGLWEEVEDFEAEDPAGVEEDPVIVAVTVTETLIEGVANAPGTGVKRDQEEQSTAVEGIVNGSGAGGEREIGVQKVAAATAAPVVSATAAVGTATVGPAGGSSGVVSSGDPPLILE